MAGAAGVCEMVMLVPSDALPLAEPEVEALAAVLDVVAGLGLALDPAGALVVEATAGLVLAGETLEAAVVDAEPELSAFEAGALPPADVDALELLVVEAGALPAGEAPRSTDVDELEASVLDA